MDGIGIKFPKVVGLRFLLDIQVEMIIESGGKESHGLERSAAGSLVIKPWDQWDYWGS